MERTGRENTKGRPAAGSARVRVRNASSHHPGLRDRPKASADHEATLASSGESTVAWYGAERGRCEADAGRGGRVADGGGEGGGAAAAAGSSSTGSTAAT
jgi:hypothetical protein